MTDLLVQAGEAILFPSFIGLGAGWLIYAVGRLAWACSEKPYGNPFKSKYRIEVGERDGYRVHEKDNFLDIWRGIWYLDEKGVLRGSWFNSLEEAQ